MDTSTMLQQIKGHVNVVTVTLLVLFVTSEIMGSYDKIKASSWYNLVKAILGTVEDQLWPQQTGATQAVASTNATVPPSA